MALIAIDRQHVGVPSREFADTGAWGDRDHDGARDVVEQEAMLTAVYGLAIEVRLRELGHQVVVLADGSYADRHRRAKLYRPAVYLALHCNAGGGDYGLVCFDHRSKSGPQLAAEIAVALGKACPQLKKVRAEAAVPNTWTGNAYNCIAGVQDGTPVAALLEPFFVDNEKHKSIELASVGRAIADGVHAWLVGVGK